jgi:hypothetical protein
MRIFDSVRAPNGDLTGPTSCGVAATKGTGELPAISGGGEERGFRHHLSIPFSIPCPEKGPCRRGAA